MSETKEYCVVLTTCANTQQADELASGLVGERLAACVQITAITSYYEWKGEANKDSEQLLLIKAKKELYPDIEAFITRNHTYEVPEIVMVPIEQGLSGYFRWIDEVSR
ncbi:MAG TPA: divalent-cation tolerance protein CutA [Deltaproteobacteria bacterium]|nr:divalent-cation tolerance protein CutA [Deltaproteobacteria bacterium]